MKKHLKGLEHRIADIEVLSGIGIMGGAMLRDLAIVVSALASTPVKLRKVGEAAEGRAPDETLWEELGALAYKQCHPLTSIDGDPAWRREMVPVFVKRALRDALAHGASAG